jgi:RimJ/RimL family protein N-acetyltransferase
MELSDAEQCQILFPHWEVVRYLTNKVPWPFPSDGSYRYIHDIALPAVERGEEWHWSLRLKVSPQRLIGRISLHTQINNNRGFWLGLPWHGQGLMTEACEAVTDHWFDELKFPVLRVPKAVPNIASRRISEKQGMRVVATEEREYVSGRFLTEIWEITAEEWRARRNHLAAGDAEGISLTGGGRTAVTLKSGVVTRQSGPWSTSVHALLRHLEAAGFSSSPRVIGSGFDAEGRETLSYIDGVFVHPHPWNDDAVAKLGRMLRNLHDATATFQPPENTIWQPWFGRKLGGHERVFGHCDLGPWNIVAHDNIPVGLIDWEVAGPVDPLVEIAQACWLNAQLHDDDVAERVGLPPASTRIRQVRLVLAIFAVPHDPGLFAKSDPVALTAFEARDFEATEAQARAFQAGVPSARVIRLPHANHAIYMSNEADVVREMRAFIKQLP